MAKKFKVLIIFLILFIIFIHPFDFGVFDYVNSDEYTASVGYITRHQYFSSKELILIELTRNDKMIYSIELPKPNNSVIPDYSDRGQKFIKYDRTKNTIEAIIFDGQIFLTIITSPP